LSIDHVRRSHGLDQPHGHHGDFVLAVVRREQGGELVAAEACNRDLWPENLAQPVGHAHQQHVAHRMAQRVVHFLEVVEVEQQHGHVVFHGFVETPLEQCAVGQPRQRVVVRQVHDLVPGPLLLRDVAEKDR
jgi:hypothetical protein